MVWASRQLPGWAGAGLARGTTPVLAAWSLPWYTLFARSSLSLSHPSNENGFVQAEEALEDRESSEPPHCLFSPPTPSQTGLQPHNRRGVWISGGQRGWEDREATDLGHSRPGAVSVGGLGPHGDKVGERGGERRDRGVQSYLET